MAHRLIRFDEDMTSITQTWIEVWSLLQAYHLRDEDIDRRHRILFLQELLKNIKDCNYDFTGYEKVTKLENPPITQWTKMEDRNEVWALWIHHLKRIWNGHKDRRLLASVRNDHCTKCNYALASHYV